mmetsp:Transcript_26265/g.45191  ORF Transcript_26265/g.45191 Transcript_26265/m.45191 type:complete len:239 (+) Transcript_26265:72-788(+)
MAFVFALSAVGSAPNVFAEPISNCSPGVPRAEPQLRGRQVVTFRKPEKIFTYQPERLFISAQEVDKAQQKDIQPRRAGGIFPASSLMRRMMPEIFDAMEDEFERMLDWPFSSSLGPAEPLRAELAWRPHVDVKETPTHTEFLVELPGVSQDDIKVEVNNDVLTIQGERKREESTKDEKFHRIERSYGKFVRNFRLGWLQDAKPEDVEAEYKDGVLHVRVKRPQEEERQGKWNVPIGRR